MTITLPANKGRDRSSSYRHCPPPEAPTTLRSAVPQILACLAAGSFNFAEGLSLSYSSSLIPALQDADSDIPITLDQGVLLASIMVVSMALGAPLAGVVMNCFGRLNTIRLSVLPFSLGWFLVATATCYEQIFAGRVLTGLSNALGVSASVVFITEVSAPHIRGALNGANPTMASLGVVGCYVLGAVTDWRTAAWICGAAPVITMVLMFLVCYESPIWLVSKGRLEDAAKALQAYARCNDTEETREELPKRQLEWLIQKRSHMESRDKIPWYRAIVDLFTQPVGYKPLILMTVMFTAQNFSGVYITLFYAAPFFQEMGVQVDKFTAAIFIGLTRFVVGSFAVFLIRNVGIRILMLVSSFGMAVCMVLSGYFTLYPAKGMDGWVPVSLVLVYVAFSCCGLLTVPWTMTAEVYPDNLRDVGQAVTLFVANLLMFLGLQLYPTLRSVLQHGEITGAVGMQWFFAVVALSNVILVVFFLPETRGKSLQEIEEHYMINTMWLGRKKLEHGPDLSAVEQGGEKGGLPLPFIITPEFLKDAKKLHQVDVVDSYRL